MSNACKAACGETSSDTKLEEGDCCVWKCIFFNNSIVDDGKFNKTAMAGLYGEAGDPNIVENIGECEAIGILRIIKSKISISKVSVFSCNKSNRANDL